MTRPAINPEHADKRQGSTLSGHTEGGVAVRMVCPLAHLPVRLGVRIGFAGRTPSFWGSV